jgi:rSAM/selenodomain-associated transferase 1
VADQARLLLGIVCRNPESGRVKTRLIPALGEEGARTLYRAFLQDLGARFQGQPYDLLWAYTPEGGPPPVGLTPGLALVQQGPDLGHRLLHLFRWAEVAGYTATIVISSDVPHLPREVVEAGFAALMATDVVLAPSEDGGYHLVGMRRPHDIFTMVPMSTPLVREQTEAVAAERGLSLHLLAADFDVDLPEDLPRLAAQLQADPVLQLGATAHVLARLRG